MGMSAEVPGTRQWEPEPEPEPEVQGAFQSAPKADADSRSGRAEVTAPTSEGTAMSSLGLYYSYTVRLTSLKIRPRAGPCLWRKFKTGIDLVKEKPGFQSKFYHLLAT